MANFIIDRAAGTATKDGTSHSIDVTEVNSNITTVEYNTASKVGKIIYSDGSSKGIGAVGFRPFNLILRRWQAAENPEVVSTEEAKARAISQIDAVREDALNAGYEYNGTLWYTDAIFQTQLTSFIAAFNAGIIPANQTVNIRGKDGSNNSLTATEVATLAGNVMAYVQTVYAESWAAKDAL